MSERPNSDLASKCISAGIGAAVATTYAAARGQSLLGCLSIMCAAIVFALVLDELGLVGS
ncbi:MAG: hypothetical protein AAFY57_06450 [Cyanobacteria bacterium J06642_2]